MQAISQLDQLQLPSKEHQQYPNQGVDSGNGQTPWEVEIFHTQNIQYSYTDLGDGIWPAALHSYDKNQDVQAWHGTNEL